jgi:ABC-type multidrug transport system fused ATPase/permease subunit
MVMGLSPSLASPAWSKTLPSGPATLVFENVSFSYNGDEDSIHDLNLTIRSGETVGVVGPSGAGKTTLRRLLTRAWDVTEGRILVNGVDVRDLSLWDLRSVFSYVPQGDEVSIFNETFAFNIAFGRPDASREEVVKAAKVAGIHDFIESCEGGYDTLLGERGLRLSGGQKQRVALARAILADCPVLILDEATSSVDSITEDEIQERLIPILRDHRRTVVVIAHDLSTIHGIADRILAFDGGRLVEEGTHEELLEKGGLYAELFERQFAKAREVLSSASYK